MTTVQAQANPPLPSSTLLDARRASTHRQRLDAFGVRHATYCDGGLMACTRKPTRPHDAWDMDQNTTHYVGYYGGLPIASARAISGDSEHGLQAEHFVKLPKDLALTDLVEISRVALLPTFMAGRAEREEALQRLLGSIVQHQWSIGRTHWVQTMRAPMALILARRLKVPFTIREVVEITDTSREGVPLSGEPLFLADIRLEEVAAVTFAVDFSVYRGLFGTRESLVALSDNRLDELLSLTRSNLKTLERRGR